MPAFVMGAARACRFDLSWLHLKKNNLVGTLPHFAGGFNQLEYV